MIHPVVEKLAPLSGRRCAVAGTSTAARVVRDHLRRLGGDVAAAGAEDEDGETAGGDGAEDHCPEGPGPAPAARAWTHGPFGTAGTVVRWADVLPADLVHDEASAQAVCGIMQVHGRRHGRPRALPLDVAGTAAGVLGTIGLLSQLACADPDAGRQAAATGVDRAALLLTAHYLAVASADSGLPDCGPGGPPFRSLDGVWFEIEALQAEPWARFWAALGASREAARDGWRSFAARFSVAAAPLPPELHTAVRRPWDEVRRLAGQYGVSICPITTIAERRRELGLDGTAEPPDPWLLRSGPAPDTSTSTSGAAAVPPAAPRSGARPERGPLGGLVVLEAGRRIQGPLAAHLLRLLGAEVIRVEPPGGDPMRGMPPLCGDHSAVWLALNHGKDAVEVDIKSERGRRELLAAVRGADVFLHNWAPGAAERLGLDGAALHRVNPALVYAHTSGWSDAVPAPPLGTDFMVQARSGVADALRHDPGEPPRPTLMTVLDSLGGMLGAEAVVAGLLHRRLTGRGSAVESSLLSAATLLLDPVLRSGRPPDGRRPDPVPAADGWTTLPDADPSGPPARRAGHDGPAIPVTTSLRAADLCGPLAAVLTTSVHGCVLPPSPWSAGPTRIRR
ncbi:CoA transferase [Streptomyces sp. TP-A0356]|uniref:YtkF n=1 Tax=Streptomyces sp. TP-A2060 TaxID=991125 RepID=I3NN50_9ACTN|nr:CoA transferase [Streptomyces sp. TP-A0356]ADZ13538.1 YtkF [Streptomyces sp. TP-A2060]